MIDLNKITKAEARLIQIGLKSAGFYTGTTRGLPGPKTKAAFKRYLMDQDGSSKPRKIASKLVALARAEVGVREKPINSNRGKRVEEYQAATWLDGTSWPWCAAFICWLCREVGMKDSDRPKTAGAWDFENWGRKSKVADLLKPRSKAKVKAGDIVIFTFSHIGLAVADEVNGLVQTIEGNTDASGSREGGGVYVKERSVRKIRSVVRLK